MDGGNDLESLLASLQQKSVPQPPLRDGAMPLSDQEVYYFFKDPSNEEYYVTNSLSCLELDDSKNSCAKETIAAVAPSCVLDTINSLPVEQGVRNTPLPAFQTDNTPQSDTKISDDPAEVPLEVLLGYLSQGKSGPSEKQVITADPTCAPLISEDSVYMDSICGVESNLSDFIPDKSLEVDDLYSNLKQVGLVTSPVKQPMYSVAGAVVDSCPVSPGLNRSGFVTSPIMKQPDKQARRKHKNTDRSQVPKTKSVKKSVTKTKRGTKPPKPARKQKEFPAMKKALKHDTIAQNFQQNTDDDTWSVPKYKVPSKKCKCHKVQTLISPFQQNAVELCNYEVSPNHRKVIYGTVALNAFMRRNKNYVSTAELLQRKIIRMPARQLHRIAVRLNIVTLPATEEELNTLKILHAVAWQTRNNELIPCTSLRRLAKYIHTGLGMGGRELLSIFKCSLQIVNPWESGTSSSLTSEGDSSEQAEVITESNKLTLPSVGETLKLPDRMGRKVGVGVDVDVSIPKSAPKVISKFVHCNCCMHHSDPVPTSAAVTTPAGTPAPTPAPTPTVTKPVLYATGPLPRGQFTLSDSGVMHDFLNKLGIDTRTNVTALVSFPTAPTGAGPGTGGVKDGKSGGVNVQRTSPDSTSWNIEPNPQPKPQPNPQPDLLQYTVDAVFGKDNSGLTSPDKAVTTECSDVPSTSPPYSIVVSADNSSQKISVFPSHPVATGHTIGLSSPNFSDGSTCSSSTRIPIQKVSCPQTVGKDSRVTAQNQKRCPSMQTFKKAKLNKPRKQPGVPCRNVQSKKTGKHSGSGAPDLLIPPVVQAREAPVRTNTCTSSGDLAFEKEPVENPGSLAKRKAKVIFTPQLPVAEGLIQAIDVDETIYPPTCGKEQVSLKEHNLQAISTTSPLPVEDQNSGTSQSCQTRLTEGSLVDGGKTKHSLNTNENACLEWRSGCKQRNGLEIPCDTASRSLGSFADNSFSMLEDALITAAKQSAANEASPDSGVSLGQSDTFFPEMTAISTSSPSSVHIPSSVNTTVEDLRHIPTKMILAEGSGKTPSVGDDVEHGAEHAELIGFSPDGQNGPETKVVCEETAKLCLAVSVSPVKVLVESSPAIEEVEVSDNMQGSKCQTTGVCVETPVSLEANVPAGEPVVAEIKLQELADQRGHLNGSSENDAPSPSAKILNEALSPSAKICNDALSTPGKVCSDAPSPFDNICNDVPSISSESCNDALCPSSEVRTWQKSAEKRETSIDRSDRLTRLVEKIVAMQTPEGSGSALNFLADAAEAMYSTENEDKCPSAVLKSLPDSARRPTAAIEKMWRPYLPKVIVGGNGSIRLNMVLMKTPQNRSLLESKNKLKCLCYVFAHMIAREVKSGHINYVEPASSGNGTSRLKRRRKSTQSCLVSSNNDVRERHKKAGAAKKTSEGLTHVTAAGQELVSLREQQTQLCPKSVQVYLGGNKLIQEMLKNNASSVLLPPSDSYVYNELLSHLISSDRSETKPECSWDYQEACSDSEVQFRVSRNTCEPPIYDDNTRSRRVKKGQKFACGKKPFSRPLSLPGKNTCRDFCGGKPNTVGDKHAKHVMSHSVPLSYAQNCNYQKTNALSKTPFVDMTGVVKSLSEQGDKAKSTAKKRKYLSLPKTARKVNMCYTSGEMNTISVEKVARVKFCDKTIHVTRCLESAEPSFNVVAENTDVRNSQSPPWQADKPKPTARKRKQAKLYKPGNGQLANGDANIWPGENANASEESMFATKFPASDRPFYSLATGNIGVRLDRAQMVNTAVSHGKGFRKELTQPFITTDAVKESGKETNLSAPVVKRKVGRPRKNRQTD